MEEVTVAPVNVAIPRDLHRTLRIYCVTKDMTLQQYVEAAIAAQLERDGIERGAEPSW